MDILIGSLAAWGLITLLWVILGVVFLPVSRHDDSNITVILRGQGSASFLPLQLRGIVWLRELGFVWWDIYILCDDLDCELIERLSVYAEKHNQIYLIDHHQLIDWMEDK